MALPLSFDENGLLPVGDHPMTLNQLAQSVLVTGPVLSGRTWDQAWRFHLVNNLAILAHQLWKVGIEGIYINGSFVEDKPHPNDIDGYFECDFLYLASGQLQDDLNRLDPHQVWTWDMNSRRPDPNSTKWQLPVWHQYNVELYPHCGNWPPSGIPDQDGRNTLFPVAFRQRRNTFQPKGIVRIIK